MTKYFYGHLIEMESIIIELNKLDLSEEQKIHLTNLNLNANNIYNS